MKKIFIPAVIIFFVGIIGLGYMAFRQDGDGVVPVSTPVEIFAKCLAEKQVMFYGAFWCPHCQNQKKLFGGAVKFLPYTECSTPDGKSQTQICKDKKIEGYPTWVFQKEVIIDSAKDPVICEIQPGPSTQPEICAQVGSKYYKVWNFSDVKVLADKDPVHASTTWAFPAGARTSGEINFENLSKFSGCEAPK